MKEIKRLSNMNHQSHGKKWLDKVILSHTHGITMYCNISKTLALSPSRVFQVITTQDRGKSPVKGLDASDWGAFTPFGGWEMMAPTIPRLPVRSYYDLLPTSYHYLTTHGWWILSYCSQPNQVTSSDLIVMMFPTFLLYFATHFHTESLNSAAPPHQCPPDCQQQRQSDHRIQTQQCDPVHHRAPGVGRWW